MKVLRLANVVYNDEPMMALEHAGELLSVMALEERFAIDWSPARFTDQADRFRHRVFSLGMAGLDELVEYLGDGPGPREAVLEPARCLYMPPTREDPALLEFAVSAEDAVPRFRWGNGRCLRGHEAPLPVPPDEPAPQLSVQVSAILGDELEHASAQQARRAIAGYCPLCVWSWPTRNRISPGWGAFRIGQLGPCLVSGIDEDPITWDVTIRVNRQDVVRSAGRSWQSSFADMISFASEAAHLMAGDVISSGPLARTTSDGRRALQPGDVVEVEVGQLGSLSGTLVTSDRRSRFL
ncbi:MAG: fumarylacetoacetate hydrolase family protein [Myxococcota bacterium]